MTSASAEDSSGGGGEDVMRSRLVAIFLDEASIKRANANIEHEREVVDEVPLVLRRKRVHHEVPSSCSFTTFMYL